MPLGTFRRLVALALLLLPAVGAAAQDDVVVELEQFGVGSTFRPGDLVGIRLRLTSGGDAARGVQLVWEVENADGDIAEHMRTLAVNPGQPASRWLYARLAPRTSTSSVWSVRVYADNDGRRGQELGSVRISPATASVGAAVPIELSQSAIAVLGQSRLGIDGYDAALSGEVLPRASMEITRVATGLTVRDLPDRWEGLAPFEMVIWSDPSANAPQSLGSDEATALLEWVRRGGHLVLSLPQAGNPWSLGGQATHRLHAILPTVAPRRVEGAPYWWLAQVLSKTSMLRNLEADTLVQVFDPQTLDNGWEPFLALPSTANNATPGSNAPSSLQGLTPELAASLDRAVVAVQRLYGHGRITLLGIDVDATSRRSLLAILPQPDAFWNRILGRRQSTPTPEELRTLNDADPPKLTPTRNTADTLGGGELVSGLIGMAGEAALGTFAAFALFAVYWLVAGPVGYALLKRRRIERHAWLAFVAASAVFTLIAWGGGAMLRLRDVRTQHVTFLDHVSTYGGVRPEGDEPQLQRATSWFSIYLPGYGPTRVGLGGRAGARDVLSSWLSPPAGSPERFPNIDRYVVPFGEPDSYDLPARATATQLEARWLGSVAPEWGRLPYPTDDGPIEVRTTVDPERTVELTGKLVHNLPGNLVNVGIVHVSPFRTPLRRYQPGTQPIPVAPGEVPNYARFVIRPEWKPGDVLDLAAELYPNGPQRLPDTGAKESLAAGVSRYSRRSDSDFALGTGLNEETRRQNMDILGIFHMTQPLDWLDVTGMAQEMKTPRFTRFLGRELDLSAWFTRPCLIVWGYLESSPSPVPVTVDGEPVPSEGLTVVRWICPLPLDATLVVPEARPFQANPPTEN
ncbi:MAG: hypothetical protein KDA22_08925 [Phycisphaerales bacterium]|nr:hypothetical protein [Phycisphaerales bacterium]